MTNRLRAGLLALAAGAALLCGCRHSQASLDELYHDSNALRRNGKLRESLAQVERGLTYSQGQPRSYWRFYLLKAELVQQIQGSAASLALLRNEPPQEPGLEEARARCKRDVGYAEYTMGNYASAKRDLDQAAAIATAAQATSILITIDFLQAQVLIYLHDIPAAEALVREAAKLADASGDKEKQAYGLDTLTQVLIGQGRYEDAIASLEKQLQLVDKNRPTVLAVALVNLGMCRHKLGQLDEALIEYQKAERLTRGGDPQIHQTVLGDIGSIYLDRGDLETARGYFQEALAVSKALGTKKTTAAWLSSLASLSIQAKNWPEAAAYNREALELKRQFPNKTAELYSLVNSALISEGERRDAEAERIFLEVAHSPSEDSLPALSANRGLAHLFSSSGNDARANQAFEAALGVVERSRSELHSDQTKIDFLANLMSVHDEYVDFLMARGKTERALEIAEATRARILQEKLGTDEATRTVSASAYRRLAQAGGATLISYWLGAKRSYVWLTTAQQVIAYPLPPQDQIRRKVEEYRALIENLRNPLESDDSAGRQLYQILLAPIADRLPPGANLIIVPDGPLNALNFETLPIASPAPHYFLEDATISVVPSLNLLIPGGSEGARASKLLLIGDPDFADDAFPKLPFAEKEMRSIESHFPGGDATVFRKAAAVPGVYQLSAKDRFDYVHFTAHASTSHDDPLDSAIILSGQAGKNKLTARDVLSQPLAGGMVVISACRSAGAKTYAGEGLVGFMWAFFRAGARSVIAGLWDVSDESTPLLMDKLYARMTQGEAPAGALRQAKLDLIRANEVYKLPYFWGPFQLYIREVPGRGSPRAVHPAAPSPPRRAGNPVRYSSLQSARSTVTSTGRGCCL